MKSMQLNLKFPSNLFRLAARFAQRNGYRNLQELVYDSVREKIGKKGYDETFTDKEIQFIDRVIQQSLKNNRWASEAELKAALAT